MNETAEIVSRAPINYQHVWVVFDKDAFEDFDEAIELAEGYGFSVAWTNQSFEYWLCLHFGYFSTPLDRSQWVAKLDQLFRNRGIRPDGYEKNLPNLYELMQSGSEENAMRNAKRRRGECGNRKPSAQDPCTTVDKLIQELRKLVK